MHKHIYIVYIPAQSTSYFQPCDVAMFRTWKSVLAAAANESFAESVVGYQDYVRLLSHAPEEKKRGVGRGGDAPRSEQNRPRERRTKVLQRPTVPASPVQPSSANAHLTSSWPCASSVAKDPRVKRAGSALHRAKKL